VAEAQDAAARRRHATVILARKIKVASRELDLPVHSRGAVRVTLPLILHLALAPTQDHWSRWTTSTVFCA
jgi:hypothetical protein